MEKAGGAEPSIVIEKGLCEGCPMVGRMESQTVGIDAAHCMGRTLFRHTPYVTRMIGTFCDKDGLESEELIFPSSLEANPSEALRTAVRRVDSCEGPVIKKTGIFERHTFCPALAPFARNYEQQKQK